MIFLIVFLLGIEEDLISELQSNLWLRSSFGYLSRGLKWTYWSFMVSPPRLIATMILECWVLMKETWEGERFSISQYTWKSPLVGEAGKDVSL